MIGSFSLTITHSAGLPLLQKYATGVLGCPQAQAHPVSMFDEGVVSIQGGTTGMQVIGPRSEVEAGIDHNQQSMRPAHGLLLPGSGGQGRRRARAHDALPPLTRPGGQRHAA